jgi:UDP-N-acetylglucosamine 2-epimerase (hydrolysing)
VKKRILFITGTRADFGKLKPLINAVKNSADFEYRIFGTGMHMLAKYGNTINEISKSGFENLFVYMNQVEGESMEVILANTITGLSRYLHENEVDLIVVHGDRAEALAGATVGALRNILVAHVEGGEISGTVDELMRHAISKLSHLHFVSSAAAEKRLKQLGEAPTSVFTIGSPDIDVMLSETLPTLDVAKKRYDIHFEQYSIAAFHPVTTESEQEKRLHATMFAETLLESGNNYIVIYPNNDNGAKYIFEAYERLEGASNVKMFPSLRFEYFLTLLRNAQLIIGNSSAGIHEAPIYGIPTINIGNRQQNRFKHHSILDVEFEKNAIFNAIDVQIKKGAYPSSKYYGEGKSAEKFLAVIKDSIWSTSNQKQFIDLT